MKTPDSSQRTRLENEHAPQFSLLMYAHDEPDTIGRAITSLKHQTVSDFELIVLDDASVNRTVLRALRSIASDGRIRFIHFDTMQGMAAAYNAGLSVAQGEYVGFPLSLDYVEPTYLEAALNTLKAAEKTGENHPDMIIESITEDHYNHKRVFAFDERVRLEDELLTSRDIPNQIIELAEGQVLSTLFNKFIRRAFIGETCFEVSRNGGAQKSADAHFDPFSFILELIEKAHSIALTHEAPYHFQHYVALEPRIQKHPDPFFAQHRRIALLCEYLSAHDLFKREAMRERVAMLYVKAVVNELVRIVDQDVHMSTAEQERWTRYLFNDPLFIELLSESPTQTSSPDTNQLAQKYPGYLVRFKKLLKAKNVNKILGKARMLRYLRSFGPGSRARKLDL